MYCRQCGTLLDESSRSCKSCGTATGARRRLILGLVAGGVVLFGVAAAAVFFWVRPPAPGPTTSVPDTPPAARSEPKASSSSDVPVSVSAGFGWSGLSAEEINAARSALDAAIAAEERIAQQRAASSGAAPMSPPQAPRGPATDGVRL